MAVGTKARAPVSRPITVYQGAAKTIPFTIFESDGTTAFDLTNFTGRAQIRISKDQTSQLLATFTVNVTDAVNGIGNLFLGATESAKVLCNGFWDFEFEANADPEDVRRISQGPVTADLNVTTP